MDRELLVWVVIFIGGYGGVLGYLLRLAMQKKPDGANETERTGS